MSAATAALGWAVLHFLWQGALVGILAAIALELVPRRGAAARYAVACTALGLCIVTFAATFLVSKASLAESAMLVVLPAAVDLSHPDFAAAAPILAQLAQPSIEEPASAMSTVAWLWALGALAMGVRLVRAGAWAHRLRSRGIAPVDAHWQRMLDGLRLDLGLGRVVRLMRSDLVDGPIVVGWLAPLILVPTTTFTALTPEQVRCVLAHELAHVRRYDHLVNALQALVEVTLFFHPVVWWLSRVAREEREYCCDRVAIDATGDPIVLARALTRLESHRLIRPSVALAATHQRGPLMQRIQRILDVPSSRNRRPLGWSTIAALASAALVVGLGLPQASATPGASHPARVSMEGRDVATDYAIVEGRVLEAVEAGNLSATDAKRTLSALRKTMFGELRAGRKPVDSRRLLPGMYDSPDPNTGLQRVRLRYDERDPGGGERSRVNLFGNSVDPRGGGIKESVDDRSMADEPKDARVDRFRVEKDKRDLHEAQRTLEALRGRTIRLDESVRAAERKQQIEELKRAVEAGQISREDLKKALGKLKSQEEGRVQLEMDRRFDPALEGQFEESMRARIDEARHSIEQLNRRGEFERARQYVEKLKKLEALDPVRGKEVDKEKPRRIQFKWDAVDGMEDLLPGSESAPSDFDAREFTKRTSDAHTTKFVEAGSESVDR